MRIVKTWQFKVGRIAADRETEILNQFSRYKYFGPDILVGAGNTELFVHDVLGLDNEDCKAVVDADAILISRPTQLNFDFCDTLKS